MRLARNGTWADGRTCYTIIGGPANGASFSCRPGEDMYQRAAEVEARFLGEGREHDTALVNCFHNGANDLVFWAFRYFLGRQTIASGQFAEDLASAWPLLHEGIRALIRRELEEGFARDDAARAAGEQCKPLGLDCDRAAWEKVRQAYGVGDQG